MDDIKTYESWETMNLNENILRGIYALGFENPSPIQSKSIIPMISKNNLIAQVQSGTGKTGAFTISALQLVNTDLDELQILLLMPTRELAIQVFEVLNVLFSLRKYSEKS